LEEVIIATTTGIDDDNDGWLWIVDPIDGTKNFASGIPLNMPIIAIAYRGEVVVGVLNDPHRNETFTTIRGRGAYCNGEKISITANSNNNDDDDGSGHLCHDLSDAVVGMESPAG
jgi:myo-inositol-1(or 4)-monophosphatase